MRDTVNICYITDNNYVQHTLVSMASLVASKYPDTTYRIIVVCNNVGDTKKKMLQSFKQDRILVELIDYSDTLYSKKTYELSTYVSSTTYIRLRLPSILQGIDKILYLDGDTIIQKDLSYVYSTDIDSKAMAGVLDYGVVVCSLTWSELDYIRNTLPNYTNTYVNAGVLLMNLKYLRENDIERKFQDLYLNRTDFRYADQDIINFALNGEIMLLPIYYNCPILDFHLNYSKLTPDFIKKTIQERYHITYDNQLDIIYRSTIIHINGHKHYIYEIPYLKYLYQRHLDMAIAYIKSATVNLRLTIQP